jgi:hypothetical protein
LKPSRLRIVVAAASAAVVTATAIVVSSFTAANADAFDLPAPELLAFDIGEGYHATGRIHLVPPLQKPDLLPVDPFDAEAEMWAELDYQQRLREWEQWRAIEQAIRDELKKEYPVDIDGAQGNELHVGRKGDPVVSWHEKNGSPVMEGPNGKGVSNNPTSDSHFNGTQNGNKGQFEFGAKGVVQGNVIEFVGAFGTQLDAPGNARTSGKMSLNAFRLFGPQEGKLTLSGHVNIVGGDTYNVNVGKTTANVSVEGAGPNGEKVGASVSFDANGEVIAVSATAEIHVMGKDVKVRVDVTSQSVNWGTEPIEGITIGGSASDGQGTGTVNIDVVKVFNALSGGL